MLSEVSDFGQTVCPKSETSDNVFGSETSVNFGQHQIKQNGI